MSISRKVIILTIIALAGLTLIAFVDILGGGHCIASLGICAITAIAILDWVFYLFRSSFRSILRIHAGSESGYGPRRTNLNQVLYYF